SRIPYTYDDWNDFWVEGIDHTVYLYEDDINSVGIRSVYVNENGEDIFSELTVWEDPDAVDAIGIEKAPVSVEWYDLQGRRVNGRNSGINIKVSTYSDGRVVREKVVSAH
ncbi:MAG: hypothetical protein K2L11_08250, partial [Muribaculaceae bacterium]|nr:hypothetical protein [Muribaculaceae bacterium]